MCGWNKYRFISHFVLNSWTFVWIVLLGCTTGYNMRGRPQSRDTSASNQPKFLYTEQNYTATKGDLAVLNCAVENLGTKTVVWRKISEVNPLTVGKMTYVADPRIQAHHVVHLDQWNLHIRDVKESDSGFYECQVSTKKRNLRKTLLLHVKEKMEEPSKFDHRSGIMITGTFHVEIGDTLHMRCNASERDEPLEDITWFKDGNNLDTNDRARIFKKLSIKDKTIKSDLYIDKVDMSDSGYYLCRISDDLTTHRHVQILDTAVNKDKRGTIVDTQGYEKQTNDKNERNNSARLHGTVVLLLTIFVEILKNIFQQ